jgi:hypothetical protein
MKTEVLYEIQHRFNYYNFWNTLIFKTSTEAAQCFAFIASYFKEDEGFKFILSGNRIKMKFTKTLIITFVDETDKNPNYVEDSFKKYS